MSNHYRVVLEDLLQDSTQDITEIPPPYNIEASYEEKFEVTYRAIQRASRLRRRMLLLVNAFYMGKLLEFDAETPATRHLFAARLTSYYRIASVRLYYLYEHLGVNHLMRSTSMTLADIRNLTAVELDELMLESLRIFNGVENLEEE